MECDEIIYKGILTKIKESKNIFSNISIKRSNGLKHDTQTCAHGEMNKKVILVKSCK